MVSADLRLVLSGLRNLENAIYCFKIGCIFYFGPIKSSEKLTCLSQLILKNNILAL